MTLPKVPHPTFKVKIPSTGKDEMFRPFLMKEEKILLMAKTGEDALGILTAVKQIVNNCAITKGFDVNKLAIFDLEYIFLKIRSNSVNSVADITLKDEEDEKSYPVKVDLNSVEVKFPETSDKKIVITDQMGLIMKYPSASMYDDKEFLAKGDDALFDLIGLCIDKVYQGDSMFDPAGHTKEEVAAFIDSLDIKTFDKIQEFLGNAPKMSYTVNYKNSLGHDRTVELTTLSDFFMLR